MMELTELEIARDSKSSEKALPKALLWVQDAAMFIDENNLKRFYDAIVRPAFDERKTRQITITKEQRDHLTAKLGAEAGFKLPALLSGLFSGGFNVSSEVGRALGEAEDDTVTLTLEEIQTPERQLEQLLAFYLLERPQRLLVGDPNDALQWQLDGLGRDVPRALVLLDLDEKAKLIPTAAEFRDGRVSLFFDKMLKSNGERPPFGPSEGKELWKWHSDNFDVAQAMKVIEDAAQQQGSRIEWIDFRLVLNDDGETMHMHLEADSAYYTGTFAYRLIRRCYGHGMRIIGTLKDGPDINVLAIYEK